MRKTPLYVSIVIDVEEEGLFTGRYPRQVTVDNVAALPTLAPLTTECGIPLTFVCAHPVFAHAHSCRVLEHMRHKYGVEIGAHLHYWSTPPYTDEESRTEEMFPYVEAKDVPYRVLSDKLHALLTAAANFCGHSVHTFRMGRWDTARSLWPLLAEHDIRVDSSVRPWQYPKGWRDHFLAPTQPYSMRVGGKEIIEIPDTSVPLVPIVPRVAQAMYRAPKPLLHTWHQSLVMLPSPVHHTLAYMKAAALVMLARGDRVLNLTWHSTEIMAGATPHVADKAAVDRVLGRAKDFLQWLARQVPVQGVTLGQLGRLAQEENLVRSLDTVAYKMPGDWHP